MNNFKLIGYENIELNVNEYLLDDMKGIVICVHGMCEHSDRYHEFANYLNSQKYGVFTYDHRGHGKSILIDEEKGFLGKDGFNKMVYDLDIIVNHAKERFPNHKVYLLGHSMGSFVTLRYLQMYNKVDGAILSGSNYGFKMLRLGTAIGKIACIVKGEKAPGKLLERLSFGSYNKVFAPNRTAFDWLSRDENVVDKYIQDEMCGFTCSNQFYYDFFKGLLAISKKTNMNKINAQTPIFIISGDKDPVGNLGKGVVALYRVLKNQVNNVEMKLYPNGRHEILNELNKDEVYQDIVNWLNKN